MLQFPVAEVQEFRDQLKEIQSKTVDGKFLGEDGKTPAGQEIVVELLNRCLKWSEIVLTRSGLCNGFASRCWDLTKFLGKGKSMSGSR